MTRGTGKTTEQLRAALDEAVSGRAVFYMTKGPTDYYVALAQKLVAEAKMSGSSFNKSENRLTFFRSGSIYFRRGDNGAVREPRTEGMPNFAVFYDHALAQGVGSDEAEAKPE